MKFRSKGAVGVGLALLLSVSPLSCATKQPKPEIAKPSIEAEKPSVVATNESPPKLDVKVYRLTPSDLVEIKVYQEDDLHTKTRVAKDGTIPFPFLVVVNIGGKTVEQAANHIRSLLAKDYLVNPQVSVSVLEYAKRRFHVGGQVHRPGAFEIPDEGSVDLLQAIAMAGGATQIGNLKKVTVTRQSGEKREIFTLNAKVMATNKKAKLFEILPDDTITVPESPF